MDLCGWKMGSGKEEINRCKTTYWEIVCEVGDRNLLSNERWILLNGRNQTTEVPAINYIDIWRTIDRELRMEECEMLVWTDKEEQISETHHLSQQMKAECKRNILGSFTWNGFVSTERRQGWVLKDGCRSWGMRYRDPGLG